MSGLLVGIEIRALQAFVEVSETGSFRQAARRLSCGQSAVSRRIQRLEDTLGVSLFERNTNGAKLTYAGKRLVSATQTVLKDMEAAVAIARSAGLGKNGLLKIGLLASLSRGLLRKIFQRFLEEHEEVEISLLGSERSEILTLLNHRQLDAIVLAGEPEIEYGDGLLLTREATYLAVPEESEWAKKDRLSWMDVCKADFVLGTREQGTEIGDRIVKYVNDVGQSAKVRCHRIGREGVMTLVGLGLGVTLVTDHWRGVRYPNVVFVPIGEKEERIPYSLIWRPENDNPALRRFISLARIEAKKIGCHS